MLSGLPGLFSGDIPILGASFPKTQLQGYMETSGSLAKPTERPEENFTNVVQYFVHTDHLPQGVPRHLSR
jgi:hypothetical protein